MDYFLETIKPNLRSSFSNINDLLQESYASEKNKQEQTTTTNLGECENKTNQGQNQNQNENVIEAETKNDHSKVINECVENLRNEIVGKDIEIGELNQTLDDKDKKILELWEESRVKEAALAEKDVIIKQMQKVICQLRQSNSILEDLVSRNGKNADNIHSNSDSIRIRLPSFNGIYGKGLFNQANIRNENGNNSNNESFLPDLNCRSPQPLFETGNSSFGCNCHRINTSSNNIRRTRSEYVRRR